MLDLSFTEGYPLPGSSARVSFRGRLSPEGERRALLLEEIRKRLLRILGLQGEVFFVGSALEFVRARVLRVLRRGGRIGVSVHCDPLWRAALRSDGISLEQDPQVDLWITAAVDPITGELGDIAGREVLCDARWAHLAKAPLPEADWWVLGAETWGVPPGACAVVGREAEEDAPSAIALAENWEEACRFWEESREHIAETLQREGQAWRAVLEELPGVRLFPGGNAGIHWLETPGIPGDLLFTVLRREGILVSTGTHCPAGVPMPPESLRARGIGERRVREGIRIALHWDYGAPERSYFLEVLERVLARLRADEGGPSRHRPSPDA